MYYGEKLNSISHLVGAVFSLVAFGALLTLSIETGDPRMIVGFSVFGLTLVLLYAMSTLYHSFQAPGLKRVFKLLDHISIYLLIAGTYTPLMLISVDSPSGTLILSLVWGLAIVGTLSEIFLSGTAVKVCQLLIYLGMGWACSLDLPSLKAGLPEAGFIWLVHNFDEICQAVLYRQHGGVICQPGGNPATGIAIDLVGYLHPAIIQRL